MFTNLLAADQSKEKMAELLEKMGLSKESIEIVVPFMAHLGIAHAGLLQKDIGADVARQVYDLAMFGFLVAYPKIQDEMDTIMKDETKRKKAIEVILEAVLASVKDNKRDQEVASAEVSTEAKATLH